MKRLGTALITMLIVTGLAVSPASSQVSAAPVPHAAASEARYAGWSVGNSLGGYGTILHTTDGEHWARQGSAGTIPDVALAGVAALDAGNCWVVGSNVDGYGTILRTIDGGATWVRQGSAATVPDEGLLKISAVDAETAWATGSNGTVIFTADGGATWTSKHTGDIPLVNLQGVFAIDADNVWVTGGPDGGYGTICRTNDGGASWERKGGPGIFPVSQIQDVHAVDLDNAWFVNQTTGGSEPVMSALQTTDGGETWTGFRLGTAGDTNAVTTVSDDVVWAVCDYSGIFRTDDNGADGFPPQTAAPGSLYLMCIDAENSSTAWACGGIHDGTGEHGIIEHTSDGGATWVSQAEPLTGLSGISVVSLPAGDFYFAEGYTGPGFQEYLCLGNPCSVPVTVDVTYLFTDGTSSERAYNIPALSRFTANVNAEVGPDREVSIVCSSDASFVAERPMYFDYTGAGASWTGGSDVIGAARASYAWYFAEGYTGSGFDEWVCILNPGNVTASLTLEFQTQEAGLMVPNGTYNVPAHSRATFKANDLLGGGSYQASLKITSDAPVVAERATYFDYQGLGAWGWTGGHCVMGAPILGRDYYFAEGYTGAGFEEWLTLQNPGEEAVSVHASYQLASGGPVEKDYAVPAASRATVYVPNEVGIDQDVSVHLSSDDWFLAERPMYFDYRGAGPTPRDWTGGHCVIGADSPGTDWFFAEGYTGFDFDQWFCIQNPGGSDAHVQIAYYAEGSASPNPTEHTVPANSRRTIYVKADAGQGFTISARIASDQPVIVERPMYFNYGEAWTGGHDVIGRRMPGILSGWSFMIDPGHGGTDSGAVGPTGLRECDVNLSVALKLESMLKADGAIVHLTRTGDSYVSIADRWQQANELGVDRFISIHHNSVADSSVNYTVVLISTTAGTEAEDLAARAADEISLALGIPAHADPVWRVDYVGVLNNTTMPSVLTEASFVSNPDEEQRLRDPAYNQREAEAIRLAVVRHCGGPKPS